MDEKIQEEEEETSSEDEASDEDKTSEKKNEEESSKDGSQPKKKLNSDVIQKIKYREKWLEEKKKSSNVDQLQKELEDLKAMVKKPTDEAEAKAQEYIRNQARQVFEELRKAEKTEKDKVARDFQEKVDAVLEENPDISEEELLDAIEEYEVEPKVALKILQRQTISKKEKPKMPSPKRASSEDREVKPDDSKKSFWQIAREEISKIKQ